ncbi:hypothetical protein ABZP36_034556 [Zizania latifolia]
MLSNISKPPVSNISEGAALKKKTTLYSKATNNPVKKAIILSDETTKCHEWAKDDGVEGTHFTGNDSQMMGKDLQDKRVKKVEKIMSALHDWPDVVFDPVIFSI